MLNFELVKSYLESTQNIRIPSNIEEVDFYSSGFYESTHANFSDDGVVAKALKDAKQVWLKKDSLAVELFAGDCRNIESIKHITGCQIKAIDIEDRNAFIHEDEFIKGDCCEELNVTEVDAFFSFGGGLVMLPSIEKATKHFKAVSKALKRGGMYYTEYQLKLNPFEVKVIEFSDAILYVVAEVLSSNSYRFHDFLMFKDFLKTHKYSVSSIQTMYHPKVYEAIASDYDLEVVTMRQKFDEEFILFRKL